MLYMAWFLLIARLLIPVTVTSGFSLFVIPAQQIEATQAQGSDLSSRLAEANSKVKIDKEATTWMNSVTQPMQSEPQMLENTIITPSEPQIQISWETALVILWLAGVAALLLQTVLSSLKLKKRLKSAGRPVPPEWQDMADEIQAGLGLKRRVRVVMIEGFPSPALSAGLRPVVVLPEEMLSQSDETVRFALLHELTHIRRKDHLVCVLLLLLRAVYWFTPIVWLTVKQMRLDMETACDSRLTRPMSSPTKKRYAEVMLSMYAWQQVRFALGMALGQTKKTAERRLRGVFMRGRSSHGARLTATLLTAVLLLACFTTACQPTPERDVVIGKGDGLSELIQSTPGVSNGVSPSGTSTQTNDALYTKLAAPKHWNLKETALDKKLNITADVDIELPGVSQLPAATASLSEFTQEDLNKIANVLGVKGAVWTQTGVRTKEQIEEELIRDRALIAEQKAKDKPDAALIKKAEESIEYNQQKYNNAPSESELKNIEFKISDLSSDGDDIRRVGFEGTTQVDGQPFFFGAYNAYYSDDVNRVTAGFGGFGGVDIDKPYGVSLTKEQAAIKASEIAKQLTDELTLCYITPAASGGDVSRKWGWACVFMREINGCPTAYEAAERPFSIEAVNVPVNYEKMIIEIDDAGMVNFKWDIPMTIQSIDNPDVSLLSFDKISQRAIEQIAQRYADSVRKNIDKNGIDWGDPGCTANIKKVKLGLMRVDKANSNDYYYIPVWKFFVETVNTDEYYKRTGTSPDHDGDYLDEDGNPTLVLYSNLNYEYSLRMNVISINALDGSTIDSDLGY